ncbi:MAG: rRNA maturation RNase YbeY [Pseudomonadota bacterium]
MKNKISIDVTIQDPSWNKLGGIEDVVRLSAKTTLDGSVLPKEAMDRDLEAGIVLANNDLLQVLNREYRNKDKPTNVLTFASLDSDEPQSDGPLNLGEVFVSFDTAMSEASDEEKFILDHVRHLIVHGVLHLLGYDHETEDEATDMETLEIRILERMNVQNPYTKIDI